MIRVTQLKLLDVNARLEGSLEGAHGAVGFGVHGNKCLRWGDVIKGEGGGGKKHTTTGGGVNPLAVELYISLPMI